MSNNYDIASSKFSANICDPRCRSGRNSYASSKNSSLQSHGEFKPDRDSRCNSDGNSSSEWYHKTNSNRFPAQHNSFLPQPNSSGPHQNSMISQYNIEPSQQIMLSAEQHFGPQQSMIPPQQNVRPQLNMLPLQQNVRPSHHQCIPQQNILPTQQNICTQQSMCPPFLSNCPQQQIDSTLNVHPPFPNMITPNNQPPINFDSSGFNRTPQNPIMFPPPFQPSVLPPPFPPMSSGFSLQFPPPATSFIPPVNPSCPPPIDDKQSLQYWNKKWAYKRQKLTVVKTHQNIKITICEYKLKVAHLSSQIKELEKLTTHLQIMSKSLSDEEWNIRKSEVEKQKAKVQEAVDTLKIIPLPEIKLLLNKRLSKRKRLKRKKEEYKEMKKENKAICQLEHSRIDAWLDKMKDQVERARREEDIKKQADYVLSEVFHKKAEAKRMLSLLTTLGKLRNARIHERQSKGEFVSKEAAESFNNIIENLKKRWIDQINGYNVEEQGLRVMLNDAEIKRCNVEKTLNKQILQQWLSSIFGDQHRDNVFQPNNLEELINVRKYWDQYVTNEDNSLIGSTIPNGWILPSPPSSDDWVKVIKR